MTLINIVITICHGKGNALCNLCNKQIILRKKMFIVYASRKDVII